MAQANLVGSDGETGSRCSGKSGLNAPCHRSGISQKQACEIWDDWCIFDRGTLLHLQIIHLGALVRWIGYRVKHVVLP